MTKQSVASNAGCTAKDGKMLDVRCESHLRAHGLKPVFLKLHMRYLAEDLIRASCIIMTAVDCCSLGVHAPTQFEYSVSKLLILDDTQPDGPTDGTCLHRLPIT